VDISPLPSARRILLTCLVIYGLTQAALLLGIASIDSTCFDEKFYVPAAKQWLARQDTGNPEQPPLGKELMAVGIALFGDRPLGWRVMSTVFGSLTLVSMYLWGLALFRNERAAWLTVLLTAANQLFYVQSRVGMLDAFMFAFTLFGLTAVCWAWDPRLPRQKVRRLLLFAGPMFGLATACKWTGALGWAFAATAAVGARVASRRGVPARGGQEDPWYHPDLFASITIDDLVSAFVIFPIAAYLVTFLPYLFVAHSPRFGLVDLLRLQKQIWDLQQRVVDPTRYASAWPSWALMLRPIWYRFKWEPDHLTVRCLLFIGNPLVVWGGLVAVAGCAWAWFKRGSRAAFWIVAFWASSYLSYGLIPRKVGYFHYYYPAAMALGPALALLLERPDRPETPNRPPLRLPFRWQSVLFLAASFGFFVYFFDLLSGVKVGSEAFRSRMWFRSWY
jgi:dolichyl-phosphate-mannose--protein O-mannosyl transferase